MELTPEEREKIYLEEKARHEARLQLAQEDKKKQEKSDDPFSVNWGRVFAGLLFVGLIMFGIVQYASWHTAEKQRKYDDLQRVTEEISRTAEAQKELEAERERVEIERRDKEEIDKMLVEISPVRKIYRDDDHVTVESSVINNSPRTVRYWKVAIQFLDKQRRVIDSTYTNALETLPPHAEKRFKISHEIPKANRVNLTMEEVQFDN